MSKPFKSLPEQIAEKLIAGLQAGKSIGQHTAGPDGKASVLPYNPTTGNKYKGATALILAMQHREDARWMTLKQGSFNKWPVKKGEKGTLITFYKSTELKPALDAKGEKQLKDGKPIMVDVKLDKPVLTNTWLYNGEQVKDIPEWKPVLEEKQAAQTMSPLERAKLIVGNSKAVISEGDTAGYEAAANRIVMPAQNKFSSEEQYVSTLLHELSHWSGHETRLDFKLDNDAAPENFAKEELRANIASILVNSELGISADFGDHSHVHENWIELLQSEPAELFKAAADAQKMADFVLGFEQNRTLKQEAEVTKAQTAKLEKGEVIPYKDTQYQIVGFLKNKVLQMEDLGTGNQFKLSPKDGLYASLMNARNNPQAIQAEQEAVAVEAPQQAAKQTKSYSRKR